MGAKLKPVHDLKTYWEREMRFRRRLSLIDGKNVFSLDAEDCDTLPYLAARPEPVRSAQWEFERLRLAAAMLPKKLKPYIKVLWAIYYHRPDRQQIAKCCGYTPRQYRNIFAKLWRFYSARQLYFRTLTTRQLGA